MEPQVDAEKESGIQKSEVKSEESLSEPLIRMIVLIKMM